MVFIVVLVTTNFIVVIIIIIVADAVRWCLVQILVPEILLLPIALSLNFAILITILMVSVLMVVSIMVVLVTASVDAGTVLQLICKMSRNLIVHCAITPLLTAAVEIIPQFGQYLLVFSIA